MMILALDGNSISFTAANTVFGKKLIHVYSGADGSALTIHDTVANVQVGSIVIAPDQNVVIEKKTTDTIAASNTINATPVKYRG